MSLFKKKKKEINSNDNTKSIERAPYDQRHSNELHSLSCVFTIVNRHQEDFYIDGYHEIGASMSVILYAYSKPPEDILSYLGDVNTKKSVIMTMCRTEYVSEMLKLASTRFKVSETTRGIAFSVPITNVAGIAVYKYFCDISKDVRKNNSTKKEK